MNNAPKDYQLQFEDRDRTAIGLFRVLKNEFEISKALYPGSHIHITPSLIFEEVVYVDSYKKTADFFENQEVEGFIRGNKEYKAQSKIRFFAQDYSEKLDGESQDFDLLISQFAGFIGQTVKPYLRTGGWLLCNDSHADASLAYLDPDYELVAVYNRVTDDEYRIERDGLENYFQRKRAPMPERSYFINEMKSVRYALNPDGYIFQKR